MDNPTSHQAGVSLQAGSVNQFSRPKPGTAHQGQPSTGYLRQWQIIGDKKRGIPAPVLEISSACLWRWVKAGKFPKPYKLSEGVTAWSAAEVHGWLAAQATK